MGAYSDRVIADGATNYWRLGETVGTTAVDVVGGKTGTISGGVTLGVSGALTDGTTGMTFNGSSGKIVTTNSVLLTPFTIELWARRNTNVGTQVLFCYTWGAGDNLVMRVLPNLFDVYTNSANPSIAFPFDTAWHHLVCVCAGGVAAKLYIDGTTATADISLVTFAAAVAKPFEIAFDPNWDYLNGSLDEVALYPRALTAAEISAHFASASGSAAGVGTLSLGYWKQVWPAA